MPQFYINIRVIINHLGWRLRHWTREPFVEMSVSVCERVRERPGSERALVLLGCPAAFGGPGLVCWTFLFITTREPWETCCLLISEVIIRPRQVQRPLSQLGVPCLILVISQFQMQKTEWQGYPRLQWPALIPWNPGLLCVVPQGVTRGVCGLGVCEHWC